jgi:hypothetical protein
MREGLERKASQIEANVKKAITNSCLVVERTAKLSMRNTPTTAPAGISRTKTHYPSEPGNAPAIDKGTLVRSVTHSVNDEGTQGHVGTKVVYGKELEFGTSRTRPRPWLGPAVEENRPKILGFFKKAMTEPDISMESESGNV